MIRLVALVASLLAVSPLRADDWPQWMGPARDGVWRETGIVEKFPTGGLKPKWEAARIGLGYAGPAVAGGRVIVPGWVIAEGSKIGGAFSRTKVPGTELVTALDAATGQQLWQHRYPCDYSVSYAAGPRCTPTVEGDRVYTLGTMGDLFCLNATTGQPVWSKNFPKDFHAPVPLWGFSSHPLVVGDLLVTLVGGDGGVVRAFHKTTGETAWTAVPGESEIGYCPPVLLDLAGRKHLVIWTPKTLNGLDPATGKRLWSVSFESRNNLTAPMPRTVGDDGVFVTAFYNGSMLVKVTPTGAEAVWKSQAKGERPDQTTDLSSIMPTPFVKNGYVYGVDSYGELRGLKAATGERLWATMQATRGRFTPERVKARSEPSVTQPWAERWANAFLVEHGDRFVLFNEQGELILAKLTPQGYEEIDRAVVLEPTNKLAGRTVVWTHPAFADRCVFVRNDEKLVCVSLAK